MKFLPLFLVLLVALSACDSPFTNEQATISVAIDGNQLEIHNGTYSDVYFAAFDNEILAFILWAPLVTEENKLEPNETITLQVDEIAEHDKGKIAVFYWDKDISEIKQIKAEYK